jgi:hypothetical protein
VRRLKLDLLFRFRVDPTVKNAAAGKHESVRAVTVNYGQFNVKWRGRSRLPHKL